MRSPTAIALLAFLSAAATSRAAERFAELRAGARVYRDAAVLSASESSIVVRHAGGISQVPLEALEPELRQRFGYDPEQAAARRAQLEDMRAAQAESAERRLAELKRRSAAQAAQSGPAAALAAAAARFGLEPELRAEVDLRGRYKEYGLTVRNQWHQPSCAIFATVGALEYQLARYERGRFDLSESHLFDATLKSLGLSSPRAPAGIAKPGEADEDGQPYDAGFAIDEVLQAIRAYGLALEGETLAGGPERAQALDRAKLSWTIVPGRDGAARVANMIHVLNTETPIVANLAWPLDKAVTRAAVLSEQTPREGAGHAVTIVGYRCKTGRLEDATFIFRNSWGPFWGAGGYGYIRYAYIAEHLRQAYVLEPQ